MKPEALGYLTGIVLMLLILDGFLLIAQLITFIR